MKRSIKRPVFFAAAVVAGSLAFGLFWSASVQAVSVGGGPFCPGSTASGPPATMCYNGQTVYNVPPGTQSAYLKSGQGTCGACPTSPP